ncbi:MAG: recombinase RecT [Shewanella sp.]
MEPIKIIENAIMAAEKQFLAVLTDNSMVFAREAGFAIQAIIKNDYLLGIAKKSPQSVVNAIVNLAAMGLSLNPAGREAYLVPRGGAIVADIGYLGYCKLATEGGSIEWVQAHCVYEKDRLLLGGIDAKPIFERDAFSKDRGVFVGVFCTAKTTTGAFLTGTMTTDDITSIKTRSESGKKGTGPWKTDFEEMAKKTVIKREQKLWPKNPRLSAAIQYSNDTGEGIDFSIPTIESPTGTELKEPEKQLTLMQIAEKEADKGVAAFKAYFKLITKEERAALRANMDALQVRATQADEDALSQDLEEGEPA